jgi:4-amino-4-deoxy-L-arabinose transferase-like glycosyltransferase
MSFRAPLLILAAAIPLFFVNLSSSSIWDANEAFYVETPREMIDRGDYVVPYFNYEPRLNKPVLSYWMVAGLYRTFGVSVGVQRFGIAIGAIVLIACAGCFGWLCGRSKSPDDGVHTALLAAAGLAVDPRLVIFARRIFIDIWISAFMALALACFALSEHLPHRRRLFLVLMYVSIGLGVLTKGPIAAFLPAFVFLIYLAVHRELRRAGEMMLFTGGLIVLAIVLPWYLALYQREGWTPIVSFFVNENVGRYTSGIGFQSSRGPLFYLPVVFTDGFPLSLFLIAAAVLARRSRDRIQTLLWLWVVVIVSFFSFSHDKQDLYVLPIVPALAALGANAIRRYEQIPRTAVSICLVLGVLLALSGIGVLYGVRISRFPYNFGAASQIGLIVLGAGCLALGLGVRRRVNGSVVTALVGLLLVNWLLITRIVSDLEQHKPVPKLAAFLRERISTGDVLSTYNVALPSMVYYLHRRVNVHYAADPFIADADGPTRMFGVLSEADYAAIHDRIRTHTCVLTRVPAFEVKLKRVLTGAPPSKLLLITNRCESR